ncbi:flavoprotein [Nocardia sp. NPDC049220]|uniref:flavoprotein n=1 Tax=Nocardia sp. NPDC049220 TaxID=3155273 RepID=UPI0033E784D2
MSDTMPPPFAGSLLIGASGSVAVAFLPMFVSALRGQFHGTVTVIMTHTATTFLPASTMGLFADKVVTGNDASTWARENHASLAAEHDLFVVLPATANVLSAAATGAAPNMLTATIIAATAPVVFFPVMSAEMWAKPAIQRNVAQLREDGHDVIEPSVGPRYDVALGSFVQSPTPPSPPQFIETVRKHLEANTADSQ